MTTAATRAGRPPARGLEDGGLAQDVYGSNNELYQDPSVVEGVDYARRFRRREVVDDGLPEKCGIPRTTVIAPHGGGIEFGTSELCLAIAGFHPATLAVTPGTGITHDYWMFEGLRAKDNAELHVISTHCDDGVALSLCGGSMNALALHGCKPAQIGRPDDARVVLVGGGNDVLKQHLLNELVAADFEAIDAAPFGSLNGDEAENIVNRTRIGMGGHLELTGPLREAMFADNTRPGRKDTTTKVFWDFAAASRNALARMEAEQVIL